MCSVSKLSVYGTNICGLWFGHMNRINFLSMICNKTLNEYDISPNISFGETYCSCEVPT